MSQTSGKDNGAQPQLEPKSGGFSHWLLWFCVFLVGYVLGIGPAVRLHKKYPAARPFIEAFYIPLLAVTDQSKPVQRCLEWYIQKVWRAE